MIKGIGDQFFKTNRFIHIFHIVIRYALVFVSLVYLLTVAEFGEVRAIYEAY